MASGRRSRAAGSSVRDFTPHRKPPPQGGRAAPPSALWRALVEGGHSDACDRSWTSLPRASRKVPRPAGTTERVPSASRSPAGRMSRSSAIERGAVGQGEALERPVAGEEPDRVADDRGGAGGRARAEGRWTRAAGRRRRSMDVAGESARKPRPATSPGASPSGASRGQAPTGLRSRAARARTSAVGGHHDDRASPVERVGHELAAEAGLGRDRAGGDRLATTGSAGARGPIVGQCTTASPSSATGRASGSGGRGRRGIRRARRGLAGPRIDQVDAAVVAGHEQVVAPEQRSAASGAGSSSRRKARPRARADQEVIGGSGRDDQDGPPSLEPAERARGEPESPGLGSGISTNPPASKRSGAEAQRAAVVGQGRQRVAAGAGRRAGRPARPRRGRSASGPRRTAVDAPEGDAGPLGGCWVRTTRRPPTCGGARAGPASARVQAVASLPVLGVELEPGRPARGDQELALRPRQGEGRARRVGLGVGRRQDAGTGSSPRRSRRRRPSRRPGRRSPR